MATHRFQQPRAPGHMPRQYEFQSADDLDSIELPTRANLGLIAGLIFAAVSVFTLLFYYVL